MKHGSRKRKRKEIMVRDKNIFEAVVASSTSGRIEDFQPPGGLGKASRVPVGSKERVELMAARAQRGEELWNEDDGAGGSLS